MRTRTLGVGGVLTLVALMAALTAFVNQAVTVRGTVKGKQGDLKTFVSLSLDGPRHYAAITDSIGRFTILKLQTDNYDVRASANGIFSEWEKNLPVQNGHTSELTLHLIYAREMPKSKSKTVEKN